MRRDLKNQAVDQLRRVISPHYYYGDSILKLIVRKILILFLYLKTKKPKKKTFIELRKLKNSREGLTAMVLGNGPSIDKLNIENVQNYVDDVFAVNSYYKTKIGNRLIPTHYVLSDPESPELSLGSSNSNNNFFEYVKSNQTIVFAPKKIGATNVNNIVFNDIEKYYGSNIDPTRPRSYTSVTLYKALAIACYLGYSKIYILGLDNSEFTGYFGDIENNIWCNNKYWSEISEEHTDSIKPEMMHLFSSGMAGRMISYSRLFGHLNFFPKSRIYNLDENSITDAFQKISKHPLVTFESKENGAG